MNISLLYVPLCILLVGCASVDSGSADMSLSRSTKVGDMPVAFADPGLFKKYSATGDSVMNSTWTRKFDASGISFNDVRTCTLVTRQHVVMASHYKRSVPSTVVFHDRYGRRLERVLVAVKTVVGDCAVGLLNEPVPDGYKVYPLLAYSPDLPEKLRGEFVLVTDQNKRLFVHEVGSVSIASGGNSRLNLTYDAAKKVGYGKILVSGDSGNPSFVMKNGEPVLVETHHTGGPGAGPFFGDPVLQAKLAATIRSMGGSGSLRFVRW